MTSKQNNQQKTIWGKWDILLETGYCKIKKITVNPGHRLSYQTHKKRQEQWTIVQGTATIILNNETQTLTTGQSIFIPKKTPHRIGNKTDTPIIFIEIQTGSYFGEDDIIRLEDDYGRN